MLYKPNIIIIYNKYKPNVTNLNIIEPKYNSNFIDSSGEIVCKY